MDCGNELTPIDFASIWCPQHPPDRSPIANTHSMGYVITHAAQARRSTVRGRLTLSTSWRTRDSRTISATCSGAERHGPCGCSFCGGGVRDRGADPVGKGLCVRTRGEVTRGVGSRFLSTAVGRKRADGGPVCGRGRRVAGRGAVALWSRRRAPCARRPWVFELAGGGGFAPCMHLL